MRIANLFLLLLLQYGFVFAYLEYSTKQFQSWYPEFGLIFSQILEDNCTAQYEKYLSLKRIPIQDDPDRITGAGPTNQLAEPVVNCILGASSEFVKANMGSAQVLLGLAPMMLATLGPSTEETSLLFLAGRRPLLATFIAIGSPAVFAMRTFEDYAPLKLLNPRKGRVHPPVFSSTGEIVFMLIEYVLALAAMANVLNLEYELGFKVICSFAPQDIYLPLLYGFLTLIVHGSGVIALYLSASFGTNRKRNAILRSIKSQFTPLTQQERLTVGSVPETRAFVFVCWATSILSTCHVIFGTLAFSSMLFISVRDSLSVIWRLMASVLLCRIILMYDLSVLRHSCNIETIIEGEPGEEVEYHRVVIDPISRSLK